MMKIMDKSVELVLCGSCSPEIDLETYPDWDRIVLEEAYEDIDYISLHRYYSYNPDTGMYAMNTDTLENIAHLPIDIGDYIDTIMAASRFVQGKKRCRKPVYISFDEWGILSSKKFDREKYPQWTEICEDEGSSTALDAVLHGAFMITMLNKCDVVKVACESIVIGSMIMADPEGKCFRQTTFYPFRDVAQLGKGIVLKQFSEGPMEDAGKYGELPAIQSAVIYNDEKKEIVVFAVNFSKKKEIPFEIFMQEFGEIECIEYRQLYEKEAFAGNTFRNPFRVVPHLLEVDKEQKCFLLPPLSWNVIRFELK